MAGSSHWVDPTGKFAIRLHSKFNITKTNHHMRNPSICFVLIFFISTASAQTVKSCKPCEELKKLQLPDVTILVAEHKAWDTIKNPSEPWIPTVIIKKPF